MGSDDKTSGEGRVLDLIMIEIPKKRNLKIAKQKIDSIRNTFYARTYLICRTYNIDAVVVYSPYYRAQCSAVDIAATTATTSTTTAATAAAAAAAIAFHSLNHI
uniref:Uncharacterized protein n=1 Tax=Glossina pallidipes TaxID=7398 RepID=A0A1A9ZB41_GLOPL